MMAFGDTTKFIEGGLDVYGQPTDGQVPKWQDSRNRAEWGTISGLRIIRETLLVPVPTVITTPTDIATISVPSGHIMLFCEIGWGYIASGTTTVSSSIDPAVNYWDGQGTQNGDLFAGVYDSVGFEDHLIPYAVPVTSNPVSFADATTFTVTFSPEDETHLRRFAIEALVLAELPPFIPD